MKLERNAEKELVSALNKGKIIILFGARQVGKTTLVKKILQSIPNSLYLTCDEPDVRAAFEGKTSSEMKSFLRGATTIAIDEAQRVRNIGISLKLLHDTFPELTIIATGSSSFDLANSTAEPLTGRNITITLYPISYNEFSKGVGGLEASRLLNERILHGMYPAIITAQNPESEVKSLARDYLFKDILQIDTIRRPEMLEKLAQLLAYQVGQLVSYNEIAQKLQISRLTEMSFIRMLEHAFIIFRLSPLGNNPRSELTRFEKIYFFDTGIRNALINDFSSMENRYDKGMLFENFFIAERLKVYQAQGKDVKQYFWRTKDGSEIDLIEKEGNKLSAFECKWNDNKLFTRAWTNAFPDVPVTLINKSVALDYL
ncbi:MAG: ATP-binding protein [Bacteroidia bacterium]